MQSDVQVIAVHHCEKALQSRRVAAFAGIVNRIDQHLANVGRTDEFRVPCGKQPRADFLRLIQRDDSVMTGINRQALRQSGNACPRSNPGAARLQ